MKFKVTSVAAGQRLDSYLAAKLPSLSRSIVKKLIDDKKVAVNQAIERASRKLRAEDQIELAFELAELDRQPSINLPVIYEDDDCLVVDKPVGILSHSKGVFNPEATVASFIAPRLAGLEGDRAGIVHRLDRATSGLMICAKNASAQSWLQKQFSQRKVKKVYYAVVEGHLRPAEALIDIAIERNPRKPKTFMTSRGGKTAQTGYQVIQEAPNYSLLRLEPRTGRTHQLRVHLKHLGHPIVGDTFYDGQSASRLMLHAAELEITTPSHQRKVFKSPLPAEFEAILET